MKNLFLPYELAVIAKEKGFNESCFAYYDKHNKYLYTNVYGGNLVEIPNTFINDKHHIDVLVPLYQQMIDWFREKHNCYIEPKTEVIKENGETITIYNILIIKPFKDKGFAMRKGSEKTINKAIKEAFKLI